MSETEGKSPTVKAGEERRGEERGEEEGGGGGKGSGGADSWPVEGLTHSCKGSNQAGR